ncbi:NACHT domain protein [Talaromyces stipitatus ATCC 10500]|uniref:NACHT domain protein n=1 Tax=Talaromyces stipitatus (strain ATCC 10500 / CBS 375.48 / QM 6759 / NRRL 1006) TaxID=441959 RepID=B8MSX3_TALSN|nr:NACHT domain protein [Talaromyces stipitatus ATCC 10500]EED12088.1 NACHT domain protein [Talaromyces stipitatus ATCC 10500]
MAVALTRIGKLTPEIQLAQAISEFEAILTLDDKSVLRNLKNRHPPDAIDIVRLTAEIDRSSQFSRKCVGTRFSNVLRAIQAFTSVGDMVVGGSQNMMASGLWASVRFTLQLATNHVSFLEKFSTLFMEIGRSAPRYQELALVYHRSSDLQKTICEYFITLVQLCTKAVQFTRRNGLNRLLVTTLRSFDSEFGDSIQKLGALGNAIKEEVIFLSAKTQQEEARENSMFRSLLLDRFDKSSEMRRKLAAKLSLLDACSAYDYASTWRRIRKKGKTASLSDCNEYITWRDNPGVTNPLICFGKLGSGKSVFTASLIEDLLLSVPKGATAYFVCRHDVTESLQSRTILGSLIRQWLEFMDLKDILDAMDQRAQLLPHTLNLDELVSMCRKLLSAKLQGKSMFLVIDGLDDCAEREKRIVMQHLHDFAENSTLRLFLTTRSELELTSSLVDKHFPRRSKMQISLQENDISDYVNDELQRRLESGSLALNDPRTIVDIQDILIANAHGMFLWVVLQIDSICNEESDDAILTALRDLPRDLPAVYDRILHRSSLSTYSKKLLQIISAVYRPLTLWELREALSVRPGDDTMDEKKFITDIQKTISSCGSLLELDDETLTVHFVHPSAKQHLLYPDTAHTSNLSIRFSNVEASCLMGGICVTYLNWGVFESQLTSRHTPWQISGSDAVSASVKFPLRSASVSRKVAQMYLKRTLRLSSSTSASSFDFKGALMEAYSGKDKKQPVEEFFFLSYAVKYWLEHSGKLNNSMGRVWTLWQKLVNNPPSIITSFPWDESDDHVYLHAQMRRAQWAFDNRHQALVLFLMKNDKESYLRLVELIEETALAQQLKGDWEIATDIRHNIVESLASAFAAAPLDVLRATWNLALSYQATEGNEEMLESLLTDFLLKLKMDYSPFIDSILDTSAAFQRARNHTRHKAIAEQTLNLAYSMSSRLLGNRDVNTLRLRHDIEHFEERHAKSLAL